MLFRIIAGASLTLALLFSGCATDKGMASLDNPTAVSKSGKAIYLLTVTLRNTHVTAYQPKLMTVRVQKHTTSEYPQIIRFEADPQGKSESISPTIGCSYLLRIELDPGSSYTLLGLSCMGQSMYVNGDFFVPIASRISPAAPGVFYLGHIEATVRARKKDEFRAGPILPVQDQSVTGASNGTFDVEITDQAASDEPSFKTKFPALESIAIQKAVLDPFNRARIQQWWEKNVFNDVP